MIASAVRSPAGRDSLMVLGGLLGGVAIGAAFAFRTSYGAAALGVSVLVVVLAVRPVLLAVCALIGVFFVQRFGSGASASGGISVSDALLALAAVFSLPALLRAPNQLRTLRNPLIGLGAYLACLLPTVFLHGSQTAYLEWAHRVVLVGGAVAVGVWIRLHGAGRLALRAFIAVSAVVAAGSCVDAVLSGFEPAYPFGLNKNLVGALLGAVVVVLIVADQLVALGRLRLLLILLVGAGLLASQSRGGLLAAATGLLAAFVLDPRSHSRRAKIISLVVTAVFVVFVIVSVRDELNQTQADLNNSSIGVRVNVERTTQDIWLSSPYTGVGLKYFFTGLYGQYGQASNNVFNNELAESGVIGLFGFLVLQTTLMLAALRNRREDILVVAGAACVVGGLVHGLVDIYWSAGSASLPFILYGIGLASVRRPRPDAARDHGSQRSTSAAT